MGATDQVDGRSMKVAIIATALPVALILIDHFLWLSPSLIGSAGTLRRTLYFPWIVVETALLAWVAGRFLGVTLYGWIFFLWGEAREFLGPLRSGGDSAVDVRGCCFADLGV